MPSAGPGRPFKDPSQAIPWASYREREVALAAGLRVAPHGAAGVQVQILDLLPDGGVRIAAVAPGDARHLALWDLLMKPESQWGSEEGEEDGTDA